MPFYAVRAGRRPGIYTNYNEVKEQVSGFSNAIFKKFDDRQEAYNFLMLKSLPEADSLTAATEQTMNLLDKDAKSTNNNTNKPNLKRKLVEETEADQTQSSKVITSPKIVGENGLRITIQNNYAVASTAEAKKLKQTTHDAADQKTSAKNPQTSAVGPLLNKTAAVMNLANNDRVVLTNNVQKAKSTRSNSVQAATVSENSKKASPTKAASKKATADSRLTYLTEYEDGLVENFSFNGKSVQVYTDGACSFNGRPNAAAGIGVYWGENHPLNISKRLKGPQTNIRAELNAGIVAISQALTYNASDITIITDSQFMIDVVTKWMQKWRTNGWVLSDGKPVKNINDVKKLDELSSKIKVTWKYIEAHKGHDGNTQADLLATGALKS